MLAYILQRVNGNSAVGVYSYCAGFIVRDSYIHTYLHTYIVLTA